MLQGTCSDVGESWLTARPCRAMDDRRLTVRPFEPQTMSDNAAVAIEDANGTATPMSKHRTVLTLDELRIAICVPKPPVRAHVALVADLPRLVER